MKLYEVADSLDRLMAFKEDLDFGYSKEELNDKELADVLLNDKGEFNEDLFSQMVASCFAEQEVAIDNVAWAIQNKTSELTMLTAEVQRLQARKKSTERNLEWLKSYLSEYLRHENTKTAHHSITFRKSASVDVTNLEVLPNEYKRMKTEIVPDKVKIKEAIKDGLSVVGAVLLEKKSISIK